MTVPSSLEGYINGDYWYHYDMDNDVLYLKNKDFLQSETLGEENDDGIIEERYASTGKLVGITIVNWWKRFGDGELPESFIELGSRIEPFTKQVVA